MNKQNKSNSKTPQHFKFRNWKIVNRADSFREQGASSEIGQARATGVMRCWFPSGNRGHSQVEVDVTCWTERKQSRDSPPKANPSPKVPNWPVPGTGHEKQNPFVDYVLFVGPWLPGKLSTWRRRWEARSLLCAHAWEFLIVKCAPFSGPQAVWDGRYGTCQNNVHCSTEQEGSVLTPTRSGTRWLSLILAEDLKDAWSAHRSPRKLQFTLFFTLLIPWSEGGLEIVEKMSPLS